ncbi:MAG: extracellular solute-binding protein [Chloroflexi bacterium]|nr:extracellular solute-binding protein [Chloroflexota bacterium]
MKSAKGLILTLILMVALVAPAASAISAQENIELHITWWGSQNRHDRTIAVIDMFHEQNPNIEVVYEFSSWGDYWTLLTTKASGENLPDIMQQDYAFLKEWQSRDLLAPLDPFIADGTLDVSGVSDVVLGTGKIGDELYGLPLGTNSQAILIDVQAFEKAGIELPAPDWTWADFEEISLALHEKLGIWGFGGPLSDEALWKSLYMGYGTWAFNPEGTAIGYEDDQPLVDYFDMILRLIDAEAIPSAEQWAEYADLGPEGNPLVTGQSVMGYWWSNQIVAITKAAGEGREFKLWHLPRPEGGQPQNYIKPSQFFSVTTQAKHPKEAAMFINFFVNNMEASDALGTERGVPVVAAVREHLAPALSPIDIETFDFLARVEADGSPVPPPDPAGWAEIRDNIYAPQFVDPVLYGEISPAEGAAMLREEANLILARNK